ncbi:hypothetical protein ElyMa_004874000 [Elysia marginata]|uniref:Uncharacterized protein n=1 Tax=Elysia marginata TaxID=1093978 RepID=A0AAV4ITM9_9GAST|nr:hypothetical protein ElyMa_004874000 [Elysia marginata]
MFLSCKNLRTQKIEVQAEVVMKTTMDNRQSRRKRHHLLGLISEGSKGVVCSFGNLAKTKMNEIERFPGWALSGAVTFLFSTLTRVLLICQTVVHALYQ